MATAITSWPTRTLAELGARVTSGSRGWAAHYAEHGSLFVRITNLTREKIQLDLGSSRFVEIDNRNAEAIRTRLAVGDLLVSITADIGIIGYIDEKVPSPAYINQHIARVRLDPGMADSRFVAYYLSSWGPQRKFVGSTDTGAKAGMNLTTVAGLETVVPALSEQRKIAEALSDVDDLIATLERLIAKKHAIGLGIMQQLLSGRTRLPGFRSPWTECSLGSVARIKTGSRNNQDKKPGGRYPFFVRSANVERIDSYSYDCEAILVPGEGGIGSIFHYVNGKFEVHQRVYKISNFAADVNARFVYYFMRQYFGDHAMENSVKATVDSLRLPTFKNFGLRLPPYDEQNALVRVLDDAESEVARLENRLAKARAIRAGMMQQLLTGRSRLPMEISS